MCRESDQGRSIIHLNKVSSSSQGTSRGRINSHATHPNIRLPGDGPESRMRNKAPLITMIFNNRQYSENKYGDDAEKKNSEKKKQKEVRVDIGE